MDSSRARSGRRTDEAVELDREMHRPLTGLGAGLRAARRRRRLRQEDVAARTGISRSAYSRMELGLAGGAPIRDWIAAARTLGVLARFELARHGFDEPADAGHLAVQDLVLRLGREAGYVATFELPIRPDTRHAIDVALRDPRRRRLLIAEIWNTIGDVGAARRSFERKLAAAAEVAAWIGGGEHTVHGVWVVRATDRNRQLVRRYPSVFAAAFPGSSRAWVAALSAGGAPPDEPGLVWSDVAATRLFEWRR